MKALWQFQQDVLNVAGSVIRNEFGAAEDRGRDGGAGFGKGRRHQRLTNVLKPGLRIGPKEIALVTTSSNTSSSTSTGLVGRQIVRLTKNKCRALLQTICHVVGPAQHAFLIGIKQTIAATWHDGNATSTGLDAIVAGIGLPSSSTGGGADAMNGADAAPAYAAWSHKGRCHRDGRDGRNKRGQLDHLGWIQQ